jgi:hypothetical protein
MRFIRCLTIAAVLVLPAAMASAQAIPDMKGTWSGMSQSIVMGTHGHHADNRQAADKPFLTSREFTLNVEGQDGRRFWGMVTSNQARERFIAVFRADGKSFLMVDEDGTLLAEAVGPNSFEACYTQTAPAKALVASCATLTKR